MSSESSQKNSDVQHSDVQHSVQQGTPATPFLETVLEPPELPNLSYVSVLGYTVAACSLLMATDWCLHYGLQYHARHRDSNRAESQAQTGGKLVVTLNPEIVVQAQDSPALQAAIAHSDLLVADGVGLLWAANQAGTPLPERVTGVDLMVDILAAAKTGARVFFLGGKPHSKDTHHSIAERAAVVAQSRYGTAVVGYHHGYFDRHSPAENDRIVTMIAESKADFLFAGLGPGQETWLQQHRAALNVGVMMGVGGALDVLTGEVQRAPVWTQRYGLEWAWRVGFDPKRWHRIPRLARFVQQVYQSKPDNVSDSATVAKYTTKEASTQSVEKKENKKA